MEGNQMEIPDFLIGNLENLNVTMLESACIRDFSRRRKNPLDG